MSQSSDEGPVGLYRKPRADLYTVLLLAAFLELVIGTVCLYLDTGDFGPTPPGQPSVQTGFYDPAGNGTQIVGRLSRAVQDGSEISSM